MSLNYAFGFSLFLLLLVALNIYFFYTLNTVSRAATIHVPNKFDIAPSVFKEIYDYLNYLPSQYKSRNPKYLAVQRNLLQSFNSQTTNQNLSNPWMDTENWSNGESLFPHTNGAPSRILRAIQTSRIALVDNAPKGTQLKLLLLLEGKQKLYFKPKRYNLTEVIQGNIYGGYDRHNSEVFAYYLAMVLNFKWISPSAIRKVHVKRDIVPYATVGLKKTMVKNDSGSFCIYGKCYYCKMNETVCPDNKGEIEGAAILYLDKPFRIHKSPWRRSYNTKKMEWEKDNDFCKNLMKTLSIKRILNLIDVAIFDFLIQNGDRHRYEVYQDKIVMLDNGKGLGNPMVDELDILAPLYQCCMLTLSTWQQLEMLSGGSLSETIKLLSATQGEKLATEDHYKAVERRLMKIYATVQYCIGKHGSAKNYRLDFMKYSSFWGGPTPTVVPTANAHVWGVIWRLHNDDMVRLDEQKGVEVKRYYTKQMKVHTPYIGSFVCRVYIQKINPLPRGDNDEIPVERWPSWTLREVMVMGAKEHELPPFYIKYLKGIRDNGEEGSLRTVCLLNRYATQPVCECRVPGRISRLPLKLDIQNKKPKKTEK